MSRVLTCLVLPMLFSVSAQAGTIAFTNWTQVDYPVDPGTPFPATWVLSNNDTVAEQIDNDETSILLSDFSLNHTAGEGFNATLQVNDTQDDDQIGIVFGYQDVGQMYLFQWKNGENPGVTDAGMHLRRLTSPPGVRPTGAEFEGPIPTGGTVGNAMMLEQNDILWASSVEYLVQVEFNATGFDFRVFQDQIELANWAVFDNQFTSGRIGLFNSSQPNSVYTVQTVPIPATIWLLGSGLGMLAGMRRIGRKSV